MSTLQPVRLTKPVSVAALRGLLYAIGAAVLSVIIVATPADLEGLGPWAIPLVWGARIAEAWILDRKQPPQLGRLGGQGPAS